MSKNKILIVDDEKIFLMAAKRELEQAGFDVTTALSGKEAVKIVETESFDIVFTDLAMPEMNGIEVCTQIKKLSPQTKVVLLSGEPEEIQKHLLDFLNAGGTDACLRKPLFNNELAEATKKILNKL